MIKFHMHLQKFSKPFQEMSRGSVDGGLLGGSHHKINVIAGEGLLSDKGIVVCLLWITSYTPSSSK